MRESVSFTDKDEKIGERKNMRESVIVFTDKDEKIGEWGIRGTKTRSQKVLSLFVNVCSKTEQNYFSGSVRFISSLVL